MLFPCFRVRQRKRGLSFSVSPFVTKKFFGEKIYLFIIIIRNFRKNHIPQTGTFGCFVPRENCDMCRGGERIKARRRKRRGGDVKDCLNLSLSVFLRRRLGERRLRKNEPGTVAELICAYIDLCPTLSVAPVEVFDQKPLTIRRLLTTAAANFVFEVNPVFDSILLMCFLMQSGVTQRMSPISL